jgi:hypothetical protein
VLPRSFWSPKKETRKLLKSHNSPHPTTYQPRARQSQALVPGHFPYSLSQTDQLQGRSYTAIGLQLYRQAARRPFAGSLHLPNRYVRLSASIHPYLSTSCRHSVSHLVRQGYRWWPGRIIVVHASWHEASGNPEALSPSFSCLWFCIPHFAFSDDHTACRLSYHGKMSSGSFILRVLLLWLAFVIPRVVSARNTPEQSLDFGYAL